MTVILEEVHFTQRCVSMWIINKISVMRKQMQMLSVAFEISDGGHMYCSYDCFLHHFLFSKPTNSSPDFKLQTLTLKD